MITMTRLGMDGQLGNQLFQYAMLRAVSIKRGFELKIPHTYSGMKGGGLVELSRFRIEAPALLENDLTADYLRHRFSDGLFRYNEAVFSQPDGTDYFGWYQTEKYFAEIESTIRREFQFCNGVRQFAQAYMRDIRNASGARPIVSLHVRRGDYLNLEGSARVLPVSYYVEAIAALDVPDAAFLVFSDDLDWCARNLTWEGITLCQSPDHWHDMAIMALCDHHVIAASSFSWWGAWLNPSAHKRVAAPTPWFGPRSTLDTSDVVPERWLKIEC